MMHKLPWMKFYPGDWVQDTAALTLAAKGAWMDLLCAMWRSKPRGKLTLDIDGYARLIRATEVETQTVITELSLREICDTVTNGNGDVTLMSRRMTREEKDRESTRYRVERFRNAHETSPSNASVTAQKSEVRSQKSDKEKNKRAQVPQFQKPTPEQVTEYGKQIGFKLDGQAFCDSYEAKGWLIGKTPMKDWQASVRTWRRRDYAPATGVIHKKSYAESKTVIRDRAIREIVLALEASKAGAVSDGDYQDAVTAMSDKYRDMPGVLKEALEMIKGRQKSLVKTVGA